MYYCVSSLTFFAFNLQVLCCLFTQAMTYLSIQKKKISTSQVSFEYVPVHAKIEQQIRILCRSYDEYVIVLLVSNSISLTARLVRARYVASRSFVTDRHLQHPLANFPDTIYQFSHIFKTLSISCRHLISISVEQIFLSSPVGLTAMSGTSTPKPCSLGTFIVENPNPAVVQPDTPEEEKDDEVTGRGGSGRSDNGRNESSEETVTITTTTVVTRRKE